MRPSLLSDPGRMRWLSPSLAVVLHGAVAASVLLGLSLTPPQPDMGPNIAVDLVFAPEPEPEPTPLPTPLPAPPPPPAPRILPKVKATPKPAPAAPVAEVASPSAAQPVAEAPAGPPTSHPATTATTTAGAAPTQPSYVPPMGRAGYLSNPKPHYPPLARKRGWEGVVTLLVSVDAEGNPLSVEVKDSSGHSVLDRCAVMAVTQWRFQPATRDGRAVAASVEVPIKFDLTEMG